MKKATEPDHWTLQVSAGVGPIEVRRFVAVLAAEMARTCTARGLAITTVSAHGDERAPRSVEIELAGVADAALADLLGTHVLIARSSDRGRRGRKRWFAGVSLHPDTTDRNQAQSFDLDDVEITAARAGGPGGQHVNKTSSAVRVWHRPSGVIVRAAGERSQHHNRRAALRRLDDILRRRRQEVADDQTRSRRLAHYQFERGRAVRVWRADSLESFRWQPNTSPAP